MSELTPTQTNAPAPLSSTTLGNWLNELRQDVRFSARNLLRAPGFSLVMVLTIALGVAATTTVFSTMNGLLLRPLRVTNADRLVALQERRENNVSTSNGYLAIPYERFLAYRRAGGSMFTSMAAYRYADFALRLGEEAVPVLGVRTSGNYFGLLGLRPALGNFYRTDDEPVAVLSHRLWQERFGSDASIVGRTVYLDSRHYTVAGIAPERFNGTNVGFQLGVWVPVRANLRATDNRDPMVFPFARLHDGIDAARAAAVVADVARRIPPEAANVRVHGARLESLTGLSERVRAPATNYFSLILATAVLVLLIASANIAGMLLARAVARRREFAIRAALGGERSRLIRQLLTESLVVFLIGALAGVALTLLTTRLLENIPFLGIGSVEFDFAPDMRVLGFALAAAGGAGILFGLAPALRLSRPELVPALKAGVGAIDLRSTRGRNVFVVAQVAAAVVLLVSAGLFVRALQRALRVDLGFDPHGVVVATTNLDPHGYDEARGRAFYRQLVERVRALPGVESVALARVILVSGSNYGNDVRAILPNQVEGHSVNAYHNWVDSAYFRTMRIRVVAGRELRVNDRTGAQRAVVINQTLARRLWPNEDPLGKRVASGGRQLEVVGVARDGKYGYRDEEARSFVFHAFAQEYEGGMTLHVRTRSTETLQQIRELVRALDPNVAVDGARPLPAVVGTSLLPQRLGATLIGVFGLLGLLLAAIGVYGVLAFQVAQRTREIGIRLAIGATVRGVFGLVVRQGTRLAAIGAVIGLLLAAAATRSLQAYLFGLSPLDATTFLAVPVLLLIVAFIASYIPARRATRVTPMETLRAE